MECVKLVHNDVVSIRHKCGHLIIRWLGSFTLETIPWEYFQKKIEQYVRNCHLYDNVKVTQITDFQHLDQKPRV